MIPASITLHSLSLMVTTCPNDFDTVQLLYNEGVNAILSLKLQTMSSFVQVLLLDEITVDLDVLARADLMGFLRSECEERGATIIYATHIFDGLESWPTHMVSLLFRNLFSVML